MKKILAVLVVLALFTGAAFAQMSIGAEVFAHIVPAQGTTADGDEHIGADYGLDRLRLSVSGQNEDGTVGGWMRMEPFRIAFNHDEITDEYSPDQSLLENILYGRYGWAGKAWYQPVEAVRLTIGSNGGDGEFALEGITGWGFYGLPHEVGVVDSGNVWWSSFSPGSTHFRQAFYGGWNAPGAFLTITPPQAEGLEVNFAIPYRPESFGDRAYDAYEAATLQATYVIDGIGKAGLTVDGFNFEDVGDARLYGYFNLTSVENLSLDLGVGLGFADAKKVGETNIAIGVGATYNMPDLGFGLNARAMIDLIDDGGDGYQIILFDVLPFYSVNETVTLFASIGIGTGLGDAVKDVDMAWHFWPYVKVSTGWAQDFYAGLRLESHWGALDGKGNSYINWAIPIGITIGF